jgi:UDP-N-acetylglucosamine acyltransferase
MIGGGFRVAKDVPPFVLAGQEPLMFEGLNSIGLKRRGFTDKTIQLLDKAYYVLYRSNLNVSQAVARIKAEVEMIPEVQKVVDFISASKRGIIPGRRR